MIQSAADQSPTSVPPQIVLMQMATANWVSQSVYVAAKPGITDLLKDSPKHYTELATATNTNDRSLFRLL